MRWADERYVRLYTRDTADWLALSYDAQGLFGLLLRKVDRAGVLQLGKIGKKAVAVVLNQVPLWEKRIAPALDELVKDGCVTVKGQQLLIRNYVAAQEAAASKKARTAAWRERQKAIEGNSGAGNETSRERDGARQPVTRRDPSLAVPSRAEPSRAVPGSRSRSRGGDIAAPPGTSPSRKAKEKEPPAGAEVTELTQEQLEQMWPGSTVRALHKIAEGLPGSPAARAQAWLKFLRKTADVDEPARIAGARKYLEHDAGKGKNLDYCAGVIRGMASEIISPESASSSSRIPNAEQTREFIRKQQEEIEELRKQRAAKPKNGLQALNGGH